VAEARCVIFEGEIDRGLALLDEAAVAALSGELDPISAGVLWCELICACQGLGQRERAEEWTLWMERWRDASGIGSFGGRCRVHRAELLRMRGAIAEAEQEALRACDELRPYLRLEFGWPLTELGRIRLVGGDLAGAEEALLDAHHIGWDPQPDLALLWLAQGDIDGAAQAIREALDNPLNVPSKELPPKTELRRAPLLVAQVEIAIAAGDLERARAASQELDRVADSFGSKMLGASAALARGRLLLAEGQVAAAKEALHEALRLWSEIGAPYEVALARTELAKAYRSEGNEQRAELELQAARSALDRIGVGDRSGAEVTTTTSQHPPVQASEPTANVFRREGDFWEITFEGRTVRIRDLVGLRYMARLLGDAGRELHVLDLVASGDRVPSGDAGVMLDDQAKEAYKRRLAEIEEDLSDADSAGDSERSARASEERDFLVRELARAVGLSGRDRRAGDASERARASVTRAIRHAMARVSAHDADLGEHLERTIRTGTYCSYLPDPRAPAEWQH
jgi:tetratricopeptide (TPR) repeat protein